MREKAEEQRRLDKEKRKQEEAEMARQVGKYVD